ncbi:MAG: hypothetical protein K2P93_07950 [Alphaproteobacteria bacterium]|nr:hypothetical protein [Alphaproteobacteria bacterium]
MLKKLVILVVIFSSFILNQGYAHWDEFKIFRGEDGSKSIKASYTLPSGRKVDIRSTSQDDRMRYLALAKNQYQEGYIPHKIADYFFTRYNLLRQKEGLLWHLYSFSSEGKELGFIQIGRLKTFGVFFKGAWREYSSENWEKVMQTWISLEIIKQKERDVECALPNLERIEERGLARILPILDLTLSEEDQEAALEACFHLISRFQQEGERLLAEKKAESYEEESTLPYQVVGEFKQDDSIVHRLQSIGFISTQSPLPQTSREPCAILTKKIE